MSIDKFTHVASYRVAKLLLFFFSLVGYGL